MTNDSDKIYRLYVEHDETNMSNPEEKREVQIGKAIISLIEDHLNSDDERQDPVYVLEDILHLAKELIGMHTVEADEKWSAKEEVGGDEDCEMQNTGPGQV